MVHSKGRDAGVVIETLNQNGDDYWNAFGHLPFVEDRSISYKDYIFSEILSMDKCSGKKIMDVQALEWFLNRNGYDCGSIDGYFEKKTRKALKKFQRKNHIRPDGTAGEETITALGGIWKGKDIEL